MRIALRSRKIALAATIALVALGIALGNWQERRAAGKIALQARMAARGADAPLVLGPAITPAGPLEYRRVTVRGRFLQDWPLFLDNRPLAGGVGFYLVMPFKIAGSDTSVLVARGWLPRDPAVHDRLPRFTTPQGEVTIEGVVTASLGHVMQLGSAAPVKPGAIVQNVDVAGFAQASGLKLQPFFVEQTGPAAPGEALVREWPAPYLGIERHKGYALQWYGLAAMAFLFFVITGFRRGTNNAGQGRS